VALVDSVSPHLSNVDVLPLKRKELREYILVSPVSALRSFLTLTCILFAFSLLAYLLACHVGNSPICTSSEFISCQALNLKKGKILCSAYSPPPLVALKIHFTYPMGRSFVSPRERAWRMRGGNPLRWASKRHHYTDRHNKCRGDRPIMSHRRGAQAGMIDSAARSLGCLAGLFHHPKPCDICLACALATVESP
jgi:hypothetical protein